MRYAIGIAVPLLVAVLMLAATPAVAERSVTVGILAFEPEDMARERWEPLIEHLDAQLKDVTVDAVIADYSALEENLRNNRLDFLLTNPSHYIRIRSDSHLSGALATLVPLHEGTPVRGFGGVAFTRAENDHIRDWDDVPGQRIAAVLQDSLGGYQAQARELRELGATPRDEDIEFTGMPHDRVVERVLDGEADVGFVRIGILERLLETGQIEPEELRVIGRQDMVDFPLALSTRVYPEWPFVALEQVPRDLSHRMLIALLELDGHPGPAQAAGIDGFTVPMDYEPVEELARELRLPPYDATPELTVQEFLETYGRQVTLVLVVASLMLVLILGLVLVNRRLTTVRRELEDKAAALERSETHARALMRALPDSLFRMDRDGTFIECEAVSEEMLLMPPEEFLGRRLDELFPPAYAEPGTRAIREALNSGEVRDFEYDTTALGMPGPFEARVVPLNDREVLMIVRDVSQRFAMEAARSEERRFRENLLASLGVGVFGIDREGRFTFINPTGCRLLGFADQNEALGRDSHQTAHHSHPDGSHYPAEECPIHGVLVSGEMVEGWEDHFWRQDGEAFPVLVYASPMRDDAGELSGVVVSFQDISIRKAMERALADSEARFRLAQEAARFGIWEWDLAEDRIHWDAQCWRMLGEDPAEGRLLAYEDWRNRIHREDLVQAEAEVQRQLAEGGKFSIEFRYRLADGGWLWTLGRGQVIGWSAQGEPRRMTGIHVDIQRLKGTEAELRQRENELAEAQRIAHMGNWISDFRSGEIRWSEEVYRIFGLDHDQWGATEAAFMERVHPDDRDTVRAAIDASVSGPGVPYQVEHRILRPDGEVRTVYQQGEVEFDDEGTPLWMLGTVFDITERKATEEALARRQAADRATSDIATRLVTRRDVDRATEESLAVLGELLGASRSAVLLLRRDGSLMDNTHEWAAPGIRRKKDELQAMNLDELPAWRQRMEQGQLMQMPGDAHPGESSSAEHELMWALGVQAMMAAPLQAAGEPVGLLGVADVHGTASWGPEDAETLRHVADLLGNVLERHRVQQALEGLNLELRRSNEELEQFAYGVSHDLRQPLRMVSSYLQLLERSLGERLDADQQRFLGYATEGARRMDRMIVGLLEYSRVGRKTDPMAPLDTREVLDTALAFLQPAVTETSARIDVEGDWPRLVASQDELVRLLQNLIDNALKYVPGDTRPEVRIDGRIDGDHWEVRVRDNGVGIPQDQEDRLFRVFSRLHGHGEYEGSGIGLALCRRIVEHHGGRIGAESDGPGHGSTFWFRIPRRTPEDERTEDNAGA
ncbi:PAS domain-containing protein [Thioalkalivibrio sp. ALE20]|uniref:PAS domain-containing protein n=1 Tax=Thioalkalivibrio sp. ALE20 TaxID=545275 RepID=UPI00035F0B1D|nr:PAS domain-containing protein [Thioalkalivibrio sp. ALE20]